MSQLQKKCDLPFGHCWWLDLETRYLGVVTVAQILTNNFFPGKTKGFFMETL